MRVSVSLLLLWALSAVKMSSNRAFNAAAVLAAGQVAGQALSFLRNMLLARYLTKADFGLAATFALSMAMLELVGRMALGQQVVQARDGGEDAFQRNAQTFQFTAGITSALLLLLASGVIAKMLGVPEQAWAFGLLGLVPLCMGLENLDTYRFQRELQFTPRVLCEFVPQFLATLAIWPLLVWLGDFRVVLWLIIGKSVLSVVMTHILAERSYRLAWDRAIARRIIAFSWPMVINGLFLFASQQADQLVVGSQFSMEQLARYVIPFSIVMVPWILFGQVVSPVSMSVLSSVQDCRNAFMAKCRQTVNLSVVASVLITLPLIVSGEQIIVIIFGGRYVGSGTLLAILATASALRFLRFAPTTAAMALGDTRNLMWANVARSSSLLLVLGVIAIRGSIEWVAACAVVGEAVALVVSFMLMSSKHRFSAHLILRPFAFLFGCVLVGWLILRLGAAELGTSISAMTSGLVVCLAACVGMGLFPELRLQVLQLWRTSFAR